MQSRRFNPSLAGSLIASVLLHLTVVIPLWMLAMNAPQRSATVRAELSGDDIERVQRPERDEPRLGLEAPNPSSLTWIGYEQYRDHIAALAEFEQAAFTEHPGEEAMDAAAVEQQEIVERETQPEPEAEPETAEPEPEAVLVEAEPVEQPEQIVEPLQVERSAGDLPWVKALLDAIEQQVAQPPVSREAEVVDAAQPEPEQPVEPTPPAEPAASPGDAPKPEADKESDATSIIDADPVHWRDGQPLAAEGVEIKPRQPQFTLLQRLTQSPGNPLVLIRFQTNGAPQSAAIVESSGSASVDSSIEASLYRWRAAGEAIEALAEGETFDVRIRIILNRRAPR